MSVEPKASDWWVPVRNKRSGAECNGCGWEMFVGRTVHWNRRLGVILCHKCFGRMAITDARAARRRHDV